MLTVESTSLMTETRDSGSWIDGVIGDEQRVGLDGLAPWYMSGLVSF